MKHVLDVDDGRGLRNLGVRPLGTGCGAFRIFCADSTVLAKVACLWWRLECIVVDVGFTPSEGLPLGGSDLFNPPPMMGVLGLKTTVEGVDIPNVGVGLGGVELLIVRNLEGCRERNPLRG